MGDPAVPRDRIDVSADVIDPGALVTAVVDARAGAVVLFLGTVRNHSDGKPNVSRLDYEVYPEMVDSKIGEIVAEARARWDLGKVAVIHRIGSLGVGEVSVGVAVSAGHRGEAFAAGRYLIDELKARAPIWKKEHWEGGAEWVREGQVPE